VWLEIHTDGYTAAYRTGTDHDTLAVYVASDCAASPDGQFPFIG
jgi:hypothetical protein